MADRDGAWARRPQLPPGSEAHFTALDLKSVDSNGAFEGYASLFDREDLGRDIVLAGAFRDSLARRGAQGVRMLFQHDPAEPIGTWLELYEDAKGLFARGRMAPGVARAGEVLSLMRSGAIDGLSIGFRALQAKRDARTGLRRIAKVDLLEISIVTFPMLPDARISGVKSRPFEGRLPSEREMERWLTRSAGMTRTAARAVMRDGMKGLAALRDAGAAPDGEQWLAERMREAARTLARRV